MTIGIQNIAFHLPANRQDNAAICAAHEFDEAFIADKLGINARYIAGPDESTADLATAAARALLDASGVSADKIGLLMVVTQTPDYCLPHTSALVHAALGLAKSVAAFDVNLGCSGFVYGLSTAIGFMEANGIDFGILVTAEEYSKVMDPADRATAPLFGDGAAATLLSRTPQYAIGRTTFGTDGSRHEALIVPGSGTRAGDASPLAMEGRAIFNFMMSEVPGDVSTCLERNGLGIDDIDAWVFHQASKFMLQSVAKRIGIAQDKVVIDLEDGGNTTSSTIPIALARKVFALEAPPRRIFLSGFGVGLSWASTVITMSETPES